MKSLPAQMQAGAQPALNMANKIAGAIGISLGAAAAGATVKQIITIGNDYTNTMNTMQAVSKATDSQMAAVSERAKQLGNDVQLPGTSASDAAAAMTELAKGGFTVEQSMAAAKGTLQLAAAAQIDAASAATIQSQALQAFGLDANYAGKAADVLANTANASSAEMTDVAQGLQQAGSVANQFGLTIEDTAASLGVLSNAGIQGSDAGTLIKSTLLALTDQGKPAQAAIKELGLTVYDAQGKFVGMSSLFGQLDAAAERMTDEQYQAATATLFGSDAMRLAGIAAEQGAGGFDTMLAAVNRQGAAAEVAAAKTQGLPGAMGSAQNAAENLALEIYDLVDGPMESFARAAADKIGQATPAIVDGLKSAGEAVGEVGSKFLELPASVQVAAGAFAGIKAFNLDDTVGDWIEKAKTSLSGFRDEMEEVRLTLAEEQLEANPPELQSNTFEGQFEEIQSLLEGQEESISDLVASWSTLEARVPAVARMGDAYRDVSTRARDMADRHRDAAAQTSGLSSRLRSAGASAVQFGGQLGGIAAAGASGLKSAVGGLVSAMGGGLMVGITAATTVVGAWYQNIKEAEAHTKAYDDALKNIKTTQSALGDIFSLNEGKYDDQAMANITSQVNDLSTAYKEASANDAKWNNVASDVIGDIVMPWRGAGDDISFEMDRIGLANRQAQDALGKTKLSSEQIAEKLASDDTTWREFEKTLRASGDGGAKAADDLNRTRSEIQTLNDIARRTTPGFFTMTEAVKVLADESSSAADRLDAMRTVLDIMSGKPIAASDALQKYNQQVRETAAATSEAWDRTQGWGQELVNADGTVNTASANGDKLRTMLRDITEATLTAASSGNDMGPIWEKNAQQFAELGTAAGMSKEEIERLAASVGYAPKNFEILASLAGADSVEQQLFAIKALLDQNANGIDIPISALTDDAKKEIEAAGIKVEEVTGKPGVFHISAPNQEALAAIQAVIDKQLPGKTLMITVDAQATAAAQRAFNATGQQGPVAPILVEPKAKGGEINGGTPGKDSVPILAMPGEHMLTTEDVDRLGGQEGVYRFRAALANGEVGKFEVGGAVGTTARERIEALGAAMDGVPYVTGGASLAGADCSGFVAQLQRAARGEEDPQGRLGTTYDLLAGSWPDLVPGTKGPFVVGTSEEHMAATIFGTNYESGGSYGAAKVGGTVGAFDAQFGGNQYYLPWEKFSPAITSASESVGDYSDRDSSSSYSSSGKKKATWTAKDETDLKSAVVAVEQAKEARERVNANPKKTDADRRQAQLKVEKAELKVKGYEEKRDAAKAGKDAPPAPDAPDLTTAYTDDELSLRSAERAVEKARLDRNEVYDDAESTQDDKDEADDQLQQAINSLEEKKKGDSKSGDSSLPSTWSDFFGEIGKEFISSNVSDILGYYGADNIGPLAQAGMAVGKAAANGFKEEQDKTSERKLPLADVPITDEEAKTQLPVTPFSTPDWMQNMLKSLGDVKVFDTGGRWRHGELGLNLSGRDEFVLNPRETADMDETKRMFQVLRATGQNALAAPQQQAGPRNPFDSLRQTVVNANGADRNEVAAGIRKADQEERWRYAQNRGLGN
ncbi:phage tail tape measure protein [Rhodococcus sp. T2V]|nr:phage tail tape measure protein [Rhodococcus sp. T2V]